MTREINISVFGSGSDNGSKSFFSLMYIQGVLNSIDPTVAESYAKRADIDGEQVNLVIHDIAHNSLVRDFAMKDANAVIITYTIISRESFAFTAEIVRQLERVKDKDIQDIPLVLVGLEAEKEEKRQIAFEQGKTLAETYLCPFFEYRKGANASEPFEAAARTYLQHLNPDVVKTPVSKKKNKSSVLSFFGMGPKRNSLSLSTRTSNENVSVLATSSSFRSPSSPSSPPPQSPPSQRYYNTDDFDELFKELKTDTRSHARLNSLELSRIQQIIATAEQEETQLTNAPENTLATTAELNDSQNQILAQVEKMQKYQEELQTRYDATAEFDERERLDLRMRLRAVDSQEKDMLLLREIKVAKYAAQNKFKQNMNLWIYYRTLHLKLEEIFIGCKTVASGLIDAEISFTLGKISSGVNLMSKGFSLIAAPEPANLGLGGSGSFLVQMDPRTQPIITSNILQMGSLGYLQKLAEYLARRITERYSEQLNLLPARSKTKKLSSSKSSKNDKTTVQNLAEYVVVKILVFLQTKKLDNFTIDYLTILFLSLLGVPSLSGKTLTERVIAKLGLDTFMNGKDECWCYSDFYTKPGRILNGIKFTSSSLLPELYGYCPTTEEEIQELQLVLDATIESLDKAVGPASPAHNKKLQDIAAHQEHISERQEFYAEMTRRTKEQNDQTTKKLEQLELTIQKLERLVAKSPEKGHY